MTVVEASAKRYLVQSRERVEVCTDPQRRCYNGAFASSEMQWTPWATLYPIRGREEAEKSVQNWTELNKNSGRALEYRAVPEGEA